MSFDAITYALAKKYADKKVAIVYEYKGSVEFYSDLPMIGNKIGDIYNALSEGGQNYAWDGTSWDSLGVNQQMYYFYR